MNQEFIALFEQLEINKTEIIDKVSNWTSEEILYKPSKTEWSAGQVLDHLFIAEFGTLRYMQKKAQSLNELNEVDSSNELSFQRLNKALKSDNKFKLPNTMPEPTNNALDLTTSAWKKTRMKLKTFYIDLPENAINKAIFKHPYAGYLNPAQALCFLSDHIEHHKLQIDTLNKKIK